MLIEFNISNFRSIRDKTSLSLVKAKGQGLDETNTFSPVTPSAPPLVRSSAIYGANAAGKSNIIKALQIMRRIVRGSASHIQAGDKLPITPFLLDEASKNNPSEFEITFVSQGVRYQYGFSATPERIMEEWLLSYPKGRPQRWIERVYDTDSQSYVWGKMDKLTGKKQLWQETTRPNALFLSTAIQLNNEQLKPVFNWFAETLHITGIGAWSDAFTIKQCEQETTKKGIIAFLKAADIDIGDVELEKPIFSIDMLPEDMPHDIKRQYEEKYRDRPITHVKTVHTIENGRKVMLGMDEESDGTKKIFSLAGPWLDTLDKGYVLVIDELHDNLHPLMVKFLIQLFHNTETNPNNAQLIFTTHETSILSQEVFRRDQIWFCEKDRYQSTRLYPLTDFSPRKGVENLEKGYLAGRYGALPYLRGKNTAVMGW